MNKMCRWALPQNNVPGWDIVLWLYCVFYTYINPQWIICGSGHPLRQLYPWLNDSAIVLIIIIVTKLLFFIIVIITFIIIIIFMICRFNEYARFTWSCCHAGVVRFLLDACYGRWFVYVKQRTASRWPLRAGGTCILLRTSFVDMNTSQHWVLIVDQSDQGNILMQWPEPVR